MVGGQVYSSRRSFVYFISSRYGAKRVTELLTVRISGYVGKTSFDYRKKVMLCGFDEPAKRSGRCLVCSKCGGHRIYGVAAKTGYFPAV